MADRALTYQVKLNLSQAKAEAAQLEALFKSELSNIQIVNSSQVAQQFAPVTAQIKTATDQYAKFQTASRAAADAANAASQQAAQGANSAQNSQTSVARTESQLRIIAARSEAQERIVLARQAATAAAEAEKRTTATVKAELAQQAAAARQAAAQTPPPGAGGTSLAGRLGQAAVAGIAGYFTIQGAQAIARQAVALDELRTKALRAEIGFKILSGGAAAAAKNLGAIQEAGGGAISKLDAMTIGVQASALGLAKTSDEFGKLTKAAREVALVSSSIHDVGSAISELGLAAANLSWRRLDQLGLSTEDVRVRFLALQTANKDLSDSEAFLAATIDALDANFGEILKTTEAGATGLERLKRAWADLSVEAAKGPIGKTTDSFFGWFAAQFDQIDLMMRNARGEVSAQMDLIGQDIELKLRQLSAPQDKSLFSFLIPDVDNSQQIAALQELQSTMDNVNAAVAAGVPHAEDYRAAVTHAAEAILSQNDASGAAADALAIVNDWYDIAARGAVELAGKVGQVTAAMIRMAGATQAALAFGGQLTALEIGRMNAASTIASTTRQLAPAVGAASGAFGGQKTDAQIKMEQYEFEWNNQRSADQKEFAAEQARIAKALEAELKRAGRSAESEFKKAAKASEQVAVEMRKSLESIPGLFNTSDVTAKQLSDAQKGIPQNFADDWLRRLKDEVLNGKDWEGVSIEEAAKRAGIDPNLPAKQILEQFSEAWNNSSLFADEANLELINQEFVNAQVTAKAELEAKIKQGQQNIFDLFGVAADTAQQAAASVASGAGATFSGGGGVTAAGGIAGALDANITPLLDLTDLQAELDKQKLTAKVTITSPTTAMLANLQATFADLPAPVSVSVKQPTTAMLAEVQATFADLPVPVTPTITTTGTNYATAQTELIEHLAIAVTPAIDTTRANYATARAELENNLAITPQINFTDMITEIGPDVLKANRTSLSNALAFKAMADFSTFIADNKTGISVAKGLFSGEMKFAVTPDFNNFVTNNGIVLGAGKTSLENAMKFSPLIGSDVITPNLVALEAAKTSLNNFLLINPTIDTAAFAAQFGGEKPVDLAKPMIDALTTQLASADNALLLLTAGDGMAATMGAGFAGHEWGTLISPMIAGLTGSISSELNYNVLYGGGKKMADILLGGFRDETNIPAFVEDFVNAVMAIMLNKVADSVTP